MAKRPIARKQAARFRKALKKAQSSSLERYINLEDWLMDRKRANTRGEARRMLEEGYVRHESHVVGRTFDDFTKRWQPSPYVPAKLRDYLYVSKDPA